MKLVELLAKELSDWPERAKNITQDSDGAVSPCTDPHGDLEFCGSRWTSTNGFHIGIGILGKNDLASDYKTAIVTREMWQAERDRQKGGEWKRHRGGSRPVDEGTWVEVKLRCGDVQQGLANAFLWRHADCDHAANIMQYKIVSKPQADDALISCIAHNDSYGKITHGPIMMGDEIVGEASPEWGHEAKSDQVETPFKWRDQVTELNAYIEKFTRERDELIERLASEGFALIPPVVGVTYDFSGSDMSDWRNWRIGDVFKILNDDDGHGFFVDQEVVLGSTAPDAENHLHFDRLDGSDYWYVQPQNVKFLRRP